MISPSSPVSIIVSDSRYLPPVAIAAGRGSYGHHNHVIMMPGPPGLQLHRSFRHQVKLERLRLSCDSDLDAAYDPICCDNS